ncbi:MAG: hypothetical protein A2275_08145 [Bacteroidetes bacterium RIFOXYA12_FULL_35_11]|nr:MAG: hypothetical protein A2X01_11255 [Bacteroidetes bacterium GWF2_35_48]OFY82638.1 MAG: hypothetical protein A2275_08145 [Bacteroidetes bacterium RIFOXYA12_FULL_35_11]OFY96573.1 MAG: hypothetical protein A2309_08030 [Bacteroidetes bacterium RIFOXYB2_FULL_35_7]HBX51339.1 hypothetical protein [Bacteroidales bacterium]
MFASIITCVYNQDFNIFQECFDSICNIKFTDDFEWIIVDDGSDICFFNGYLDIINKYNKPLNITIKRLENNSGLSIARNEAINLSNGEWVISLDSDDKLEPHLIQELKNLNKHVNIAAFEVNYFNSNSSEYRKLNKFKQWFEEFGLTDLDPFLWFDFYYHGIIAKKNIIEKIGCYDNFLKVGEDQDILIKVVHSMKKENVAFIEKLGYHYRNNENGVCKKNWDEVLLGYTSSMLKSMKRLNQLFIECRFGGTITIDESIIDIYEYKHAQHGWLNWYNYKDIKKI